MGISSGPAGPDEGAAPCKGVRADIGERRLASEPSIVLSMVPRGALREPLVRAPGESVLAFLPFRGKNSAALNRPPPETIATYIEHSYRAGPGGAQQ